MGKKGRPKLNGFVIWNCFYFVYGLQQVMLSLKLSFAVRSSLLGAGNWQNPSFIFGKIENSFKLPQFVEKRFHLVCWSVTLVIHFCFYTNQFSSNLNGLLWNQWPKINIDWNWSITKLNVRKIRNMYAEAGKCRSFLPHQSVMLIKGIVHPCFFQEVYLFQFSELSFAPIFAKFR